MDLVGIIHLLSTVLDQRERCCEQQALFHSRHQLHRFTAGLINTASTTAAAMLNKATSPNNVGIDMFTDNATAFPASQLPMLMERNQIAIMNPAARSGASLLVAPKPMGLIRHNSPSVCST